MININRKSGAVLIISLIILLLLTLIGATAIQTTTLEEKMAGNLRDANLAFQAAETALRAGENSLNPPASLTFGDAGTGGFYSVSSTIPTASAILTTSFWTAHPVATYTGGTLSHVSSAPHYIIVKLLSTQSTCPNALNSLEFGQANPPVNWYQIIARGTGTTDNAVVNLQSIYKICQ
jgi:type IV pilus assembly protein PilX